MVARVKRAGCLAHWIAKQRFAVDNAGQIRRFESPGLFCRLWAPRFARALLASLLDLGADRSSLVRALDVKIGKHPLGCREPGPVRLLVPSTRKINQRAPKNRGS